MEIFSFFAGVVYFYTHFVVIGFIALIALYLGAPFKTLFWFIPGIAAACFHDKWVQTQNMPRARILSNVMIEGVIATIPKVTPEKRQFQFELSLLNEQPVQANVWMACYQACPDLKVGEKWQFRAKLKRPPFTGNPGAFNFKNWLTSNHIAWTGMIKGESAKHLSYPKGIWRFQAFRSSLADQLEQLLKNDPTLGLIQGLTLGVASHIPSSQWELFRRTGTTHLVVISGEHIGLIAGFFFMVIQWIWPRLKNAALFIPSARLAGGVSFVIAGFYAFLAGLGAPVERALIAFGFLLLRYVLSQRFTVWQAWRYALFLIVCIEPHTVLTPGFYLSFLAVAILMTVSLRFEGSTLRQMIQLQAACLFGLLPVTLYCFSYGAWNGYIVNLIAIPLVGLVIVPTALIGLLLAMVYPWEGWFYLSKWCSHLFFMWLNLCDRFEFINLDYSLPDLSHALVVLLGMGLFILMPIRVLYPIYALLIYAGYFPSLPTIKHGEAKIEVLDVGQGLAVLVRTEKHALLYDTGGQFYKSGDWATFTILPYFKRINLQELDAIVVSHPDLDHRGGLKTLESALKVKQLIVNSPHFYGKGLDCHDFSDWSWDEVHFQFLSLPASMGEKNNRSCVLKVHTKKTSLLLTGDIEAPAEQYLVEQYYPILSSDVLLVPHHGSKTSSSERFLEAIHPSIAVISSGFDNRYHLPHKSTVMRYRKRGVKLLNTAHIGWVQLILGDKIDFNLNK